MDTASNQQQQQQKEKFMTYLPHSGLHNQRISLINAMVIAKILNRTLLMPEMNIGTSTSWKNSTMLAQQLELCPSILTRHDRNTTDLSIMLRCHHYAKYIPIPVEDLFDLTVAQKRYGIRTKQRKTMKQDYRSMNDEEAIFTLNDTVRYAYQFYYKNLDDHNRDAKYETHIDLELLKDRPELYMEFGSLFGGTRIALQHHELIQMRDDLHREIGLNHSIINKISQDIIYLLGNNYTSLHLRQGDGAFKRTASETIQSVSTTLHHNLKAQQRGNTMTKEDEYLVTQSLFYQQRTRSAMHRLEKCLSIQNLNILNLKMIYLATDAKKPKEQFKQLYDQYACLFTLNDFFDVIQERKSVDQLLPMIDAEIASHATLFIGTPASTFSAYIRHRNSFYFSKKNTLNHLQKTIK